MPCESGLTDVPPSIEADGPRSCAILERLGPRTGASAVTILRYALGQGRDLRAIA